MWAMIEEDLYSPLWLSGSMGLPGALNLRGGDFRNMAVGREAMELDRLGKVAALRKEGRLLEARALCRVAMEAEDPYPPAVLLHAEIAACLREDELIPQLLRQMARVGMQRSRHFHEFHKRAVDLLPDGALAKVPRFLQEFGAPPGAEMQAHCLTGRLFELAGQLGEAQRAYERALALDPHHDFAFSRRSTVVLARKFGEPVDCNGGKRQAPGRNDGVISMSALGTYARFGNQLVQYGFLRLLGAKLGYRVEVPAWMGRYLFDLDDPPVSRMWAPLDDQNLSLAYALCPELVADHDLDGYFQHHTRIFRPQKELFQALFQPGARLRAALEPLARRLAGIDGTLVALHLRRGDFGSGRFWIAPEAWYLRWLEAIWPRLRKPVLYVATDAPEIIDRFRGYSPLTAEIAEPIEGAEFYTDFFALTQAHVLATSNSTFSFGAGMLNRRAVAFFRPSPKREGLVPFDPWNAPFTLPNQPATPGPELPSGAVSA
jgi:hypothetical protein